MKVAFLQPGTGHRVTGGLAAMLHRMSTEIDAEHARARERLRGTG